MGIEAPHEETTTGDNTMAKASEIARRRVTKADSTKWLAAMIGFVVANVCVFAATVFANGGVGFFYYFVVAALAAALPIIATFFAMRANSAEFKVAWLACLMVGVVLWVWLIATIKYGQGIAMFERALAEAEARSDRRIALLDAGRPEGAALPVAAPTGWNPIVAARDLLTQYLAQRPGDWATYRKTMPPEAWRALADADVRSGAVGQEASDAWFRAGNAAVDAWGTVEIGRLQALRGELSALSLPDNMQRRLLAQVDGYDGRRKRVIYSEKLVVYRARDVARVLDRYRWRRVDQNLVFADRTGANAYEAARSRLERALAYRGSLSAQPVTGDMSGLPAVVVRAR
jgi:hypothetical protein